MNKGKEHVSCFSLTVYEEFIDVIATKVLDIIIFEIKQAKYYSVSVDSTPDITNVDRLTIIFRYVIPDGRDVAAAPQTPQLGGGPRPTLGAQVSLKLLFGYVTIFSSADLFTTDLNCRKKLACDIISECNVILSRRI